MIAPIHFIPIDSSTVKGYQLGTLDANGQKPEIHISDGIDNPCRHCLELIKKDEPFLVLAHRPFPKKQPYAEVGPIFIHKNSCLPYGKKSEPPAMFLDWQHLMLRGYGADERIIYGSGQIVPTTKLRQAAAMMFKNQCIAYIHVRSASNNCFQCRIERA